MYLITGANGQLGRELRLLLPEDKAHFVTRQELDISNEKQVMDYISALHPTCIINCAAYTAVDCCEEEEDIAYRVNALGPQYLAKAANDSKSKLIHISTDYVFDGTASTPYKESDPTSPINAYGRTKLAGENFALSETDTIAIIRTSWLYSAFGKNFVSTMIRLGKEKNNISVVADQMGTPTNAADLAQAILTIAPQLTKQHSGIYHFSNEGQATWYEFACEIMRLGKLDCQVQPIPSDQFPTPTLRPAYSLLDKSKIKTTFGIKIQQWEKSLGKI
ncbi:MAG: dTDP-4-dehydrorhamnose reductase [Akkermansia sp.]